MHSIGVNLFCLIIRGVNCVLDMFLDFQLKGSMFHSVLCVFVQQLVRKMDS